MKLNFTYTVFALAMAAFLGYNNSAGPITVQNQDRTGGPLANGFCGNTGCHASGAFDPSLEIVIMDGSTAVTEYVPGQTYTVEVTINAGNGSPAEYGLQAVALTETNEQAGSYADPGAPLAIKALNNLDYIEHTSPSNSNTFTFDWIAPAAQSGPVTIYASGVAANDGMGSGGDGADAGSITLTELVSGINNIASLPIEVELIGNPILEDLRLTLSTVEHIYLTFRIVDRTGSIVHQKNIGVASGLQQLYLPTQNLATGTYFLQITDGKGVLSRAFVKY